MPRRAASENVVQLTKAFIATLTPKAGQGERVVWDAERKGLGVRIRSSGARSWVIRPPRSGGSSRLHTLGTIDSMSLAVARATAEGKLAEAAGGIDPTKAKDEARKAAATTFGSFIDRYVLEKQEKGRRPSTIGNLKNHLLVHWAPLHVRPVGAINRAEVAKRHREIVTAHGTFAADRALSILSSYFVWLWKRDLVQTNPAAVKAHDTAAPVRRDRVLNDKEIAAIWRACRDDDFGRIVRTLICTGQRRNEVAGIARSEIDFETNVWIIPRERSKNHRAHEVPLSPLVMSILAPVLERKDTRAFLFGDGVGPFSGFSKAKAALDKRLAGAVAEWTVHDIRRSVASGMARIGISLPVIEKILNHVSGSFGGIVGVYQRHSFDSEKRQALDAWGAHIEAIVKSAPEA